MCVSLCPTCVYVCVFLCCWPGVCLTAGSPVSAGLRVWLSLRILGLIRGLTLSSVGMLHVVQHYSTSGRRRTWDPASQAGVVLNFLDSSRFTFLSAVVKAVQCKDLYPECTGCTTVFPNLFLSSTFQPGLFLIIVELQPGRSSATRSSAPRRTVVLSLSVFYVNLAAVTTIVTTG